MQFNEFQRRLDKCHLDPDTKFLLSHMFEVQIEFSKQLDMAGTLIAQLTEAVNGFVQLHERTQEGVQKLLRQGRPDGVDVFSVVNDPEEND